MENQREDRTPPPFTLLCKWCTPWGMPHTPKAVGETLCNPTRSKPSSTVGGVFINTNRVAGRVKLSNRGEKGRKAGEKILYSPYHEGPGHWCVDPFTEA